MIDPAYLAPGIYVDSDHPEIIAYARRIAGDAAPRDAAVKLYYAVRDDILYDPYRAYDQADTYRASAVLAQGRGYCVGKAALLAASCRALGIPARVAFADVRNHLATPRLLELIGTDVFIYHGITELWLDGHWVKATPTFNISLCDKFHIKPLDFDGLADAILHPYDQKGRDHMQYVRERGAYIDVPVDIIRPAMLSAYPRLGEALRTRSDFAREAERDSSV
jgi:transglutaminase-like putative cysteine protease